MKKKKFSCGTLGIAATGLSILGYVGYVCKKGCNGLKERIREIILDSSEDEIEL